MENPIQIMLTLKRGGGVDCALKYKTYINIGK